MPRAVLPSPRFSRAIGLVLDLFRGGKIAVAVFWATFYAYAAIFGLVSKVVVLRMCYTKSRLILRLFIITTVNYQFIASQCL